MGAKGSLMYCTDDHGNEALILFVSGRIGAEMGLSGGGQSTPGNLKDLVNSPEVWFNDLSLSLGVVSVQVGGLNSGNLSAGASGRIMTFNPGVGPKVGGSVGVISGGNGITVLWKSW
jgi:hypothetical protein